jgi:hypothetical protein
MLPTAMEGSERHIQWKLTYRRMLLAALLLLLLTVEPLTNT